MGRPKSFAETNFIQKWTLRIIPGVTWLLAFIMFFYFLFAKSLPDEGIIPVLFVILVCAYIYLIYFILPNILVDYFKDSHGKGYYFVLAAATAGIWPLILYYKNLDRNPKEAD